MSKRKILLWAAVICLATVLLFGTVSAAQSDGWVLQDNNIWSYYENGTLVCDQVRQINGKYYGFDWEGKMYTGTDFSVYQLFGKYKYYRAKADGSLYTNTWYQEGQHWYYYGADGAGYEDFKFINGAWYFFEKGRMCADEVVLSEDHSYYAVDQQGHWINTPGKHAVGGNYVYVKSSGWLAEDEWVAISGKWYYFTPYMVANQLFENWDTLYAVDNSGVCIRINGDGIYDLGTQGKVYIEDGELFFGWKYLDGAWYFFFNSMLENCVYKLDGEYYVFDQNGRLFTDGWILLGEYESWQQYPTYQYAYADSSGKAAIGVHVIHGKTYIFDRYGYLYQNTLLTLDDAYYVVDETGVATKITTDGWHQVSGSWYYMKNGSLLTDTSAVIKGKRYVFNSNGVMQANGLHGCYVYGEHHTMLLGADGVAKKGWQMYDSHWYYADANGFLLSGEQVIDGKTYILTAELEIGTFWRNGQLITTDSSGAVLTKGSFPDGWSLVDGQYFYYKDGEPYTGWVGDYYINGGYMRSDSYFQDKNAWYAVDETGRHVKSGWYQMHHPYSASSNYVYAKSGGKLCRNEWCLVDGFWYYFDHVTMVSDCVMEIDGEMCRFAKDGRYLGKVTEPTFAKDGWHQIGEDWYYAHAGKPVKGLQTIGGKKYLFGEDGVMLSGGFFEYEETWYYLSSSGAIPDYTGWKLLDGQWCYFDRGNLPVVGWLQDQGKVYHTQLITEDGKTRIVMTTGYWSDRTCLHLFGQNGAYQGTIEKENGWYQAGSDWYYFENGRFAGGSYSIDGKGYHFTNGKMVTDDIYYNETGAHYYGSNGQKRTTVGWYKTSEGWIYVFEDGTLADGHLMLGGKLYAFDEAGLLME